MMTASPVLEIDLVAEAAYLRLSDNKVAETCEVSDSVLVDLDDMKMVVGVELLDLDTAVPTELTKNYHVKQSQIEMLKRLGERPSRAFLLSSASQGTSESSSKLEFA